MPAATGWKILFDAATKSFLNGAFLPWFFLSGINLFIYEVAVADGFSIVGELRTLDDFDQAIVLLFYFASVGGLAAISAAAGDFVLSFFDARVGQDLKFKIGQMRSDEKLVHFLNDFDAGQTSVQNMGTLFFGTYLTILVQASAMYTWEANSRISVVVLSVLTIVLLATWFLARSQAQELRREMSWLRKTEFPKAASG